jgi:hypothetical protein
MFILRFAVLVFKNVQLKLLLKFIADVDPAVKAIGELFITFIIAPFGAGG